MGAQLRGAAAAVREGRCPLRVRRPLTGGGLREGRAGGCVMRSAFGQPREQAGAGVAEPLCERPLPVSAHSGSRCGPKRSGFVLPVSPGGEALGMQLAGGCALFSLLL